MPDHVNIDKEPLSSADLLHDLEVFPWPFADNAVDEIRAHHVLEHLGGETEIFLKLMQEIYRVLRPNGIVSIKVPFVQAYSYWNDPTHVRVITPSVLALFSKKECERFKENNWPNTPLALYLDVDFDIVSVEHALMPHWGQRWTEKNITQGELDFAIDTHWNVVDAMTIVIRKVE
jgi:SAM-dependent methyltransferase